MKRIRFIQEEKLTMPTIFTGYSIEIPYKRGFEPQKFSFNNFIMEPKPTQNVLIKKN